MNGVTRRVLIGMAAVLALVLGYGAAPAAAHTTNPWSGTHTVCRASWCINTGNLVRLWQAILWADGYYGGTGNIDGQFGPNTHSATVAWQTDAGVGVDGEAGPQTWGRAQARGLVYDVSVPGGYHRYYYRGAFAGRSFEVRQGLSGSPWQFRDPNSGTLRDTSHGS